MINFFTRRAVIVALLFFISSSLMGEKKALDHSVYDSWKGIRSASITDDGNYAIAHVVEQEGDSYLLIRNLKNNKELIVDRGYNYRLSSDNTFLVAQIKAPYAKIRQARIDKLSKEKQPKDTLIIVRLKNLSVEKIPNVKSYNLAKESSSHLVFELDDTVKRASNVIVVRDVKNGRQDTIQNVSNYLLSESGRAMAVLITPEKKDTVTKKGIVYCDLQSGEQQRVSSNLNIYTQLNISKTGDKLSFLASQNKEKDPIKEYSLYCYTRAGEQAIEMLNSQSDGVPTRWTVSENKMPNFSENERRLFVYTAPKTEPKDTLMPAFERPSLDIWHWSEPQLKTMQIAELRADRTKSYQGYIDVESGIFTQLATPDMPSVYVMRDGDGRYVLGMSNLLYRFEVQWDIAARQTYDTWKIDLETGEKKELKKALAAIISTSPEGRFIVWYDLHDRNYYSYSFETEVILNLTEGVDANFWDQDHDMPSVPGPYGTTLWLENDAAVLVYGQYDIWQLDPTGKIAPKPLTNGIGRKTETTFRHIKTDPDAKFLTPKESVLLTAFDNVTKEGGVYLLEKGELKKLVMDKYTFAHINKAKNKNVYLYAKSNFNTSPDLYATKDDWKKETKLTDINPQMKDYYWGTAELVSWQTYDKTPITAEGLLYKPENFDPNKKYPMMVYFYERLSENLYKYYSPAPSRSTINIPLYTSNGYIVFVPDIHYSTGYPGQSAYNSIISGVKELMKNQWVDQDRIGMQGQSWGGYQVAHLVTKTNLFKAAGAGAPVGNMFSAYGGIRWGTGRSRQYQYEQTQSRLGETMWDAFDIYKENSPVFGLPEVETPLLIMHNDKDEAVPWYQSIEIFMGLRRLGKPTWLLQYNNESHNLGERRNAKDLSIRLQQFFDHYLKDAPMPVWMKSGVPALEKDETLGYELVE